MPKGIKNSVGNTHFLNTLRRRNFLLLWWLSLLVPFLDLVFLLIGCFWLDLDLEPCWRWFFSVTCVFVSAFVLLLFRVDLLLSEIIFLCDCCCCPRCRWRWRCCCCWTTAPSSWSFFLLSRPIACWCAGNNGCLFPAFPLLVLLNDIFEKRIQVDCYLKNVAQAPGASRELNSWVKNLVYFK